MSDENPYGGSSEPPDESRPAAPSPYQGPPAPPPPGNYPAGGYYAPPQRSDRWKIWLGIGLAIPALIVTGTVAGAMSAVDDTGSLSGIAGLAGLVVPLVLLFFPVTRKVALGLLIAYAVLFILFAGACVALIALFNSSY